MTVRREPTVGLIVFDPVTGTELVDVDFGSMADDVLDVAMEKAEDVGEAIQDAAEDVEQAIEEAMDE